MKNKLFKSAIIFSSFLLVGVLNASSSSSSSSFPKLVVADVHANSELKDSDLTTLTTLTVPSLETSKIPSTDEAFKVELTEIIAAQNRKIEEMFVEVDKTYRLALAYPKFDTVSAHKSSYFGKKLKALKDNPDTTVEELEAFYTKIKKHLKH